MPVPLIEFPADDPGRARRFWGGVLGIHDRGRGPGDTASLPYFTVADLPATLARVRELGGAVIHPGERWAVCRDSEGSPFALVAAPAPAE